MKLYFTRHGKTKWNEEKRLQGQLSSDLLQEGINASSKLHDRIGELNLDLIVSSPLKRAKDTAEIVRGNYNIPLKFDDRLMEMCLGEWEGKYMEDIKSQYKEDFIDFKKYPENFSIEGGETFNMLLDRVSSFLLDIFLGDYENVLVVTHGLVLKTVLTLLYDDDISSIPNKKLLRGCSLLGFEIDYKNDKVKKILDDNQYEVMPL